MESGRSVRIVPKRGRVEQKKRGRIAERTVQKMLEELPMDHFIVMNDIRFKYGNIDHLVIRDDGALFMIETKACRGTVTYDGKQLLANGRPFTRNPISQIYGAHQNGATCAHLNGATSGEMRGSYFFPSR